MTLTHIHKNEPAEKQPLSAGEIVRIDFTQATKTWVVTKFAKKDTVNIPMSGEIKPLDFDLAAALKWCRDNGWIVRQWPGGARAWRYALEPVRTTSTIIRMRDDLRIRPRPELLGQGFSLDLAYDL